MQKTTKHIEQIKTLGTYEVFISFVVFCLICGIATLQLDSFIGDKTYPKWICLYLLVFTCTCHLTYKVIKRELFLSKQEMLAFCLYMILIFYLWQRGANIETTMSVASTLSLYISFKKSSQVIHKSINYAIIASSLFSIGYSLVMITNGESQIKGTYENSNALCYLLVYSAIILQNKHSTYYIWKGLLALNISAIISTSSRAGILAMILCFCCTLRKKLVYCIFLLGVVICVVTNFKKESSLGRAFIYETTVSMLDTPKHIILGYGHDGFRKYYMSHQANTLVKADISTRQRADNIQHPLNDFLLLTINYGIIATILVVCIIGILLRHTKLEKGLQCYFCATIIFCMFGYPFNYPITWVTFVYALAYTNRQKGRQPLAWAIGTISIFSGIIISEVTFKRGRQFNSWNQAIRFSHFGMVEKAQKRYEQLEVKLADYPEFNYNYAYFLLKIGQKKRALSLISLCNINNYDTQILTGDIYSALGNYPLAIEHYSYAEQMCPNRFLPLFAKFQVYEKLKDKNRLRYLGTKILSKSIKVPSYKINNIKQQVKIKLTAL